MPKINFEIVDDWIPFYSIYLIINLIAFSYIS